MQNTGKNLESCQLTPLNIPRIYRYGLQLCAKPPCCSLRNTFLSTKLFPRIVVGQLSKQVSVDFGLNLPLFCVQCGFHILLYAVRSSILSYRENTTFVLLISQSFPSAELACIQCFLLPWSTILLIGTFILEPLTYRVGFCLDYSLIFVAFVLFPELKILADLQPSQMIGNRFKKPWTNKNLYGVWCKPYVASCNSLKLF